MALGSVVLLGVWTTWLTPVWIMSAGVTLGVGVLLLLCGILWLISRRAAAFAIATVREGILLPIGYTALVLVAVTLVLSANMPIGRLVDSLRRVMAVGEIHQTVDVPPQTTDQEVAISFRSDELRSCTITSAQDIVITTHPDASAEEDVIEVIGGEPYAWQQTIGQTGPFQDWVVAFYVTNSSDAPSRVEFDLETGVEYPEVFSIPATAACLVGLFLIYLLITATLPKMSAIAVATTKEACSQPIFYLTLGLGAFALIAFIYVPYNTFGEDVKVLKDSGLTLIMVLSIAVALWTASVSVAAQIEGRTALTVLSKPISRRQFILGKFLGIIWPVVLIFVLLGVLFLVTVSYKVVYDARESAGTEPIWQECYAEMISTVPGLVLAWMETVVLTSISVAISTRLSMLPNLIICASIYVLGHLGPMIVNSAAGKFEIVGFVGRLIATVLPVLGYFNMQAAIAYGAQVPLSYLAWALVYCALYSTIAMLLALALFEDRDLA